MARVAQEITQLGETHAQPVRGVATAGTLLAEIQRFRAAFREQIGNLVFDVRERLRRRCRARRWCPATRPR